MHTFFAALLRQDGGGHPVEYALLVVGVVLALIKPHLFVAAFYRLTEVANIFVSQVVGIF